jgi:hypothetical protein
MLTDFWISRKIVSWRSKQIDCHNQNNIEIVSVLEAGRPAGTSSFTETRINDWHQFCRRSYDFENKESQRSDDLESDYFMLLIWRFLQIYFWSRRSGDPTTLCRHLWKWKKPEVRRLYAADLKVFTKIFLEPEIRQLYADQVLINKTGQSEDCLGYDILVEEVKKSTADNWWYLVVVINSITWPRPGKDQLIFCIFLWRKINSK